MKPGAASEGRPWEAAPASGLCVHASAARSLFPTSWAASLGDGRREPSPSAAERGERKATWKRERAKPSRHGSPVSVSGSRHAYGGEHRPRLRKVGALLSGGCGAPAGSGAGRAAVISVGVTKREGYSGRTTAAEQAASGAAAVGASSVALPLCPAEGCCAPCGCALLCSAFP